MGWRSQTNSESNQYEGPAEAVGVVAFDRRRCLTAVGRVDLEAQRLVERSNTLPKPSDERAVDVGRGRVDERCPDPAAPSRLVDGKLLDLGRARWITAQHAHPDDAIIAIRAASTARPPLLAVVPTDDRHQHVSGVDSPARSLAVEFKHRSVEESHHAVGVVAGRLANRVGHGRVSGAPADDPPLMSLRTRTWSASTG